MWIAVVIVVLALAMMVGPIMLMQPTKRQRRLAQLRSLASEQGLKVRMLTMPQGAVRGGEPVALYCRPWSGSKALKDTWLLVRQHFAHGLHFQEDWDWADDRRAPAGWHDVLLKALPELPASVIAVEASSHTLGVAWLESTGEKSPEQSVEALSQWLQDLAGALSRPRSTPHSEAN